MEDDNRLAMESGTAAFQLNYPFVYPSMKANKPELFKSFHWAPYPGVDGRTSRANVTIGGINLAVSTYSRTRTEAFEAALCLRNRENQKTGAIKGGLPPSIADLYDDPALAGGLPVPQGHPGVARHRRGSAPDARLPEHVDRDLPRGVAARRHRSPRARRRTWRASSRTRSSRRG